MSTFGWTPSEHRDYLEQFQQRQEHEDAMKDTTQPHRFLPTPVGTCAECGQMNYFGTHLPPAQDTEPSSPLAGEPGYFDKNAAIITENALLRRSLTVLTTRIEELEAVQGNAEALLESLERIAAVLKTFYFAPVTISSLQPILALALEFNKDIIEQRR